MEAQSPLGAHLAVQTPASSTQGQPLSCVAVSHTVSNIGITILRCQPRTGPPPPLLCVLRWNSRMSASSDLHAASRLQAAFLHTHVFSCTASALPWQLRTLLKGPHWTSWPQRARTACVLFSDGIMTSGAWPGVGRGLTKGADLHCLHVAVVREIRSCLSRAVPAEFDGGLQVARLPIAEQVVASAWSYPCL